MSNYTGSKLNKEVAEKHFEIKGFVTGDEIETIILDGMQGIGYWADVDFSGEQLEKYEGSDLSRGEK